MRLLHFSDIHLDLDLGDLHASDWLSKRAVGALNHALRRRAHFVDARAKLDHLVAFADAQKVDLCVCTGDLTILGTEAELLRAERALRDAFADRSLLLVGGNHDCYLEDGTFSQRFAPWQPNDLPEAAPNTVRLVGSSLAVIGIRSTRPNRAVWRSNGRILDEALVRLADTLRDPRLAGRFVVVMTHYAPRLANGRADSWSHGLENADDLIVALSGLERGCLLHGHVHRRYSVPLAGTRLRALCAGSTTQAGREGLWLLDIERDGVTATPGGFADGRYVLHNDEVISLAEGVA